METTVYTDYGVFKNILDGIPVTIKTSDINQYTIGDYQKQLCNIFIDYIEVDKVQNAKITFAFDNGMSVRLTPSYALLNIIVWSLIIKTGQTIKPKHVFFNIGGINSGYIKKYIDMNAILPTREKMSNGSDNKMILYDLNRTIADTLQALKFCDQFAWYYNNSVNNEDFIMMYLNCPQFKEIIDRNNTDYYSSFGPDKMNEVALQDMNTLIDCMKDAKKYIGRDHVLSNAFRAGVGIKPKQAREMYVNIGIKPNGEGGIFPYEVNTSYMSGGSNNVAYHMVESLTARIAQILSKKNTAKSGAFARLMNLNCSDSRKYTIPGTDNIDPSFDCCTRNYVMYNVKDRKALYKIADRYYRTNPNSMDFRIHNVYDIDLDSDLIGKTICLRSPITCKSAAEGKGICRKCMGELYNILNPVNIGVYCVTQLTEKLTQMMLSAKHLLEAKVTNVIFENPDYDVNDYVYIDEGSLYIKEIPNIKKWQMVICQDDISTEAIASIGEDEDDEEGIEDIVTFCNVFHLVNTKTGDIVDIKTKNVDQFYFSEWLVKYIDQNHLMDDEDDIVIPLSAVTDLNINLFNIGIQNDDMNARLESVIKVIDLKANTSTYTKETFLETLSEKLNDIGLSDIMSVHLEVIIMNQLRRGDDILERPEWEIPNNTNYQVLTLNQSLTNHPSIAISAQGKNVARTLYSPLSSKKTAPSPYDLIYCLQPQKYIEEDPIKDNHVDEIIHMVVGPKAKK